MENQYLALAERVLDDTRSAMTAREIWDRAHRLGWTSEVSSSPGHSRALAMSLARAAQRRQDGQFLAVDHMPARYRLRRHIDVEDSLYDVADSRVSLGSDALLARIRRSSGKVTYREQVVRLPERNPDVIAYVRLRAGHRCELCGWRGFRKDNGAIYIEVHHLRPLADGGMDLPENASALCPDCHRMLHSSDTRRETQADLIEALRRRGIDITSPTD